MEIWNPRTKSVELVADEIPPEKDCEYWLAWGELLTIKGGTEFIFYGGGGWDSPPLDIWKYDASNGSWARYFFNLISF
jgi:hypothetical protein